MSMGDETAGCAQHGCQKLAYVNTLLHCMSNMNEAGQRQRQIHHIFTCRKTATFADKPEFPNIAPPVHDVPPECAEATCADEAVRCFNLPPAPPALHQIHEALAALYSIRVLTPHGRDNNGRSISANLTPCRRPIHANAAAEIKLLKYTSLMA